MLSLEIGDEEGFDNEIQEFVKIPGTVIALEHSLISVSKWESQWEKPFLDQSERTTEETISYIKAMCLTEGVDEKIFDHLDAKHLDAVNKYISAKMTATWFSEQPGGNGPAREVITSELIYYWMVALAIPFECQYWHLNRLLTLVRVCNEKNQPKKKMSAKDAAARQRALNEQRKAQYNTSG